MTAEVEMTELEEALDWLTRVHDSDPSAQRLAVVKEALAGVYDEGRSQGWVDAMRAHCDEPNPSGRLLWIMAAMDAADTDPSPYKKEPNDG